MYLSQVEEGHRVTRVISVDPAFLTGAEELHVPDLSFAFRNKISNDDVMCLNVSIINKKLKPHQD